MDHVVKLRTGPWQPPGLVLDPAFVPDVQTLKLDVPQAGRPVHCQELVQAQIGPVDYCFELWAG
jgi:hypothetical protein